MHPLPKYLFLDTNIFDKQHYNFESREMLDLKRHFTRRQLTLLLPDPIEKEIRRHLKERSKEAAKALKSAEAQAPFVKRISSWPLNGTKKQDVEQALVELSSSDLHDFLAFYNAQKLGYGGVAIGKVMEAYDQQLPPFALGAKAKEFPDAFAIAILDAFHLEKQAQIIVVSSDEDIRKACETRPHLIHFHSLSAFIGRVEIEISELTSKCLLLVSQDDSLLETAIAKAFENLGFSLREDWSADIYGVNVVSVDLEEVDFTGVRGLSCSASFVANVTFSVKATYDDWDSAVWDSEEKIAIPLSNCNADIQASTLITGSIIIHVNPARDRISNVSEVEIDKETITVSLSSDWD